MLQQNLFRIMQKGIQQNNRKFNSATALLHWGFNELKAVWNQIFIHIRYLFSHVSAEGYLKTLHIHTGHFEQTFALLKKIRSTGNEEWIQTHHANRKVTWETCQSRKVCNCPHTAEKKTKRLKKNEHCFYCWKCNKTSMKTNL